MLHLRKVYRYFNKNYSITVQKVPVDNKFIETFQLLNADFFFLYSTMQFKCCGYNNLFTWNTNIGIPSSCISMSAYPKGCKYVFTEYIDKLNLWLVLANFPFIEVSTYSVHIAQFGDYEIRVRILLLTVVINEFVELFPH